MYNDDPEVMENLESRGMRVKELVSLLQGMDQDSFAELRIDSPIDSAYVAVEIGVKEHDGRVVISGWVSSDDLEGVSFFPGFESED